MIDCNVIKNKEVKIAIVGLGYVGLPLAVEFGKQFSTMGFDINQSRLTELKAGHDGTLETDDDELASATLLQFTSNAADLSDCQIYIVTVPTPIDSSNRPDLPPLLKASECVASVLSVGNVVIYESTVYPGTTEEDCIPVLEEGSGLKFNQDFYCGYSPERINPGDKERRLTTILKITSGSTPEVSEFVDKLYLAIIKAGTYKAESIKVAEAAKVIENTNGLLRQYFPKGIDFRRTDEDAVAKAVRRLNNRPRKCLGYRTPNEVFWPMARGALAI